MSIVVSTWALHRTLGISYPDSPATGPSGEHRHSDPQVSLANLPHALREHGFDAVEICHFHVPSVDRLALSQLRRAYESAGVRIQSLLIDDGDLSDPENGQRDADWIAKWIDAAAILGAERARVIAGKSSFDRDAFERSLVHVTALADHAEAQGVRLTIENWFPLLSTPAAVLEMLERT